MTRRDTYNEEEVLDAMNGAPINADTAAQSPREAPNVSKQWARMLDRIEEELRLTERMTAQTLGGGGRADHAGDRLGHRCSPPQPELRTLTAVALTPLE